MCNHYRRLEQNRASSVTTCSNRQIQSHGAAFVHSPISGTIKTSGCPADLYDVLPKGMMIMNPNTGRITCTDCCLDLTVGALLINVPKGRNSITGAYKGHPLT